MRAKIVAALLGCAALLAALPSVAAASFVEVRFHYDEYVAYSASAGEANAVRLTGVTLNGGLPALVVHDGGARVDAGQGCRALLTGDALCVPALGLLGSPTRVHVSLEAGPSDTAPDSFTSSGVTVPIFVWGGVGDDTIDLRNGRGGDEAWCVEGNDVAHLDPGDTSSGCETVTVG